MRVSLRKLPGLRVLRLRFLIRTMRSAREKMRKRKVIVEKTNISGRMMNSDGPLWDAMMVVRDQEAEMGLGMGETEMSGD